MTNETNDKQLAEVSRTVIISYGSRDDVREITDRLMKMHPQAEMVGVIGMRAVAQMAIMLGANPLPTSGEIYVWKDWSGNVVTDLGIAYYRRKASEKDTVLWVDGDEPRNMTEEERITHCIPDNALGAICRGFLMSEYTKLLELGVPWQIAQKQLARTSTARVGAEEMFYSDTDHNRKKGRVGKPLPPPAGRTWQWVAEKRAEKGFYRMKSLVDTTLTDTIQAHAKQVLATVKHGNGRFVSDDLQTTDMSIEEFNQMVFDAEIVEPVQDLSVD